MAEKQVKIRITTAAEGGGIEKSQIELKRLKIELVQMQKQLRLLKPGSKEFDELALKIAGAEQRASRLNTTIKGFNAQQAKATGGMRMMRGSLQQAGYQVGDFAVQVGGGTSALTAFAQQGSQLLGVLGPWGAVAGAALAIGAAVAKAAGDMKDAGEDADELKERLAKVGEAAKEAFTEIGEAKTDEIGRQFNEAEKDISEYSDEVERAIRLEKKLRDDRLAAENAEAAAEIAKIEASGAPEIEKLEKIAAIKRQMAEKEKAAKLAEIEEENRLAEAQADAALDSFENAKNQEKQIREQLAEEQARLEKAEADKKAVLEKQRAIKAAEKAEGDYQRAKDRDDWMLISKNELELKKVTAEDARKRANEMEAPAGAALGLDAEEVFKPRIESASEAVKRLEKELIEYETTVKDARRALEQTLLKGVDVREAGQSEQEKIERVTAAEETISQTELDQKRLAVADKMQKRKLEEDLQGTSKESERTEFEIEQQARAASLDIEGGGRNSEIRSQLNEIAKEAAKGLDENEIRLLKTRLKAATEGQTTAMVEALMEMFQTLEAQRSEMENIKGQLRGLRDGS